MKHQSRYTGKRTLSDREIYSHSDGTRYCKNGKRYSQNQRNKKKKWSGKKKAVVAICIILAIVLAAAAGVFIYIKAALGQMARVELPQTNPELGITSEAAARAENSQVTNIALFGVDSRNDDDVGRSDALMILSIDRKHGKIKLTSIARDTYVSVDGYGQTKINHAYVADTHFPNLDEDPEWEMTKISEEQTYFDLEYVFTIYERKQA